MKKIKILIIDDHSLIRQSWKTLLAFEPNFEVVGDTGSGLNAVALIEALQPDIVTVDINMPGLSGFEVTESIRKSSDCKILCISMHSDYAYVKKMMQAGANGYLTKNAPMQEFIKALTDIFQGKNYFSEEVKNMLANQMFEKAEDKISFQDLSSREMEIVHLLKEGHTSKDIAKLLFVAVKTIEVHRYNILKKLKLKNSATLIHYMNQQLIA